MEYTDLIKTVSIKCGLSISKTAEVLKIITDTVNRAVNRGESVEIEGLGMFSLTDEAKADNQSETLLEKISDIVNLDLKKIKVPRRVLQLVPEHIARQYDLAPISLDGNILTIVMLSPSNVEAQEFLNQKTGLEIKSLLCTINELEHILNQYMPQK